MKEIWVYAECVDQKAAPSYYELLTKAKALADVLGDTVICGVLLGADNASCISELKESGAQKIYSMEHPVLKDYNLEAYSSAFQRMIEQYEPEMVIIAASGTGSELAPTVAGKVKTGLAAHCVDLRADADTKRINCMVPAFGGKVISEIYIPDTRPIMASVRPGILEACELEAQEAEVVTCSGQFLDEAVLKEEFLDFEPYEQSGQPLESASFVLSVGRGVSEEAYAAVRRIADKTGAAVGYTRSFVDTGMVADETNLIGTSGKSVKPKVLLEFGISGAVHYISGMNKSGLVISVNTDENAKIFNYSDYGCTADSARLLRELEKRF